MLGHESRTSAALDEGRLSAAKMLAWRAARLGLSLPRVPEACVLTHQGALVKPRRGPFKESALRVLSFPARTEKLRDAPVLLAACSVGAPATAIAVEELASLGTKRLLLVDIAGSIDAGLPSGSVVLAEGALCRDGTSPHYTREAVARPDAALSEALSRALSRSGVEHSKATVWTTDVAYRETDAQIDAARGLGAKLVDMETASVLAVAASTGIAAAAVLVVADELFDGWRPPAGMSQVQGTLRRLMTGGIACLQSPR